jgi:hypothetical protein
MDQEVLAQLSRLYRFYKGNGASNTNEDWVEFVGVVAPLLSEEAQEAVLELTAPDEKEKVKKILQDKKSQEPGDKIIEITKRAFRNKDRTALRLIADIFKQ